MTDSTQSPTTYKDSGVDIDAADQLVDYIKQINPPHPAELNGIGPFAAIFDPNLYNFKDPLIVSSTDGVGTKFELAQKFNHLATIGIDLVAMCVNDLITTGAKPLFFLDYYSTHCLDLEKSKSIIKSIVDGCTISTCSLIGGETAEHPPLLTHLPLPSHTDDLAGFSVGLVERDQCITGEKIKTGNQLIGVLSNGIHSNGYSFIRRRFFSDDSILDSMLETYPNFITDLLQPTLIYTSLIESIRKKFTLNGIAHITGGGIPGNLPRIIPQTLSAIIDKEYPIHPLFETIKDPQITQLNQNTLTLSAMAQTFNMGLGLVLVVEETDVNGILETITSHALHPIYSNLGPTSSYQGAHIGYVAQQCDKETCEFPFHLNGKLKI